MYYRSQNKREIPTGLGLRKQADNWFTSVVKDAVGTWSKHFGEHSEKYTQGHELLSVLPGNKAALFEPLKGLYKKHGGDFGKVMGDPEFSKAASRINKGLTQEDLAKLSEHRSRVILPHLQREYQKARAGGYTGTWQDFKNQQMPQHFSVFEYADKLHAAGGAYNDAVNEYGVEGAQKLFSGLGQAYNLQGKTPEQLMQSPETFATAQQLSPYMSDPWYSRNAAALGLPAAGSQQYNQLKAAGLIGWEGMQDLTAVSGYSSNPSAMFGEGGQKRLSNIVGILNDKNKMNAIKAADPAAYNQLYANADKLRFANANYGSLQTLHEFQQNPLMFIFTNLFGNPSRLYSVIDSMGKMYRPQQQFGGGMNLPAEQDWYGNMGKQYQQYASLYPWMALLGNIRSSIGGDNRSWSVNG